MHTQDAAAAAGKTEKTLTFPKGIPGFEKYTTYVIYHKEENDLSAYWLESCDEPKVTFTLVDPGQYGLSYELQLSDEELEVLQADRPEDLGIFMILSKKEDPHSSTPRLNANIIGPVVINLKNRLGLQKVIRRSRVNAMIIED